MSEFIVRNHPGERQEGVLLGIRIQLPSGRWSDPGQNLIVLVSEELTQTRGSVLVDWCGLELDSVHEVCVTLRDTLAKRFHVAGRLDAPSLAEPFSVDLTTGNGVGTLNGVEIGFHLLKREMKTLRVVGTRFVSLALDPLGATVQPRFRTEEAWVAEGFPALTGWAFEGHFGEDVATLADVGTLFIHERHKEALTSVRPEGQGLRRQLQCAIGVDVWADLILRAADRLEDENDRAPVLTPLRDALKSAGVAAHALRSGDADAHSRLRASLQASYFEEGE